MVQAGRSTRRGWGSQPSSSSSWCVLALMKDWVSASTESSVCGMVAPRCSCSCRVISGSVLSVDSGSLSPMSAAVSSPSTNRPFGARGRRSSACTPPPWLSAGSRWLCWWARSARRWQKASAFSSSRDPCSAAHLDTKSSHLARMSTTSGSRCSAPMRSHMVRVAERRSSSVWSPSAVTLSTRARSASLASSTRSAHRFTSMGITGTRSSSPSSSSSSSSSPPVAPCPASAPPSPSPSAPTPRSSGCDASHTSTGSVSWRRGKQAASEPSCTHWWSALCAALAASTASMTASTCTSVQDVSSSSSASSCASACCACSMAATLGQAEVV
mmetsp:Transcript_13433/g.42855  ORF Transcript_13433/g.42855 Transcript_13433/m.42855 type:complete len:328 (-) Transcript_13433:2778-3761(-)